MPDVFRISYDELAKNKLAKFADVLSGLKFSQSSRIITGALNSAMRAYYKAIVSGTVKNYNVKSGFLKTQMQRKTASKKYMTANIYATGRRQSLEDFKVSPKGLSPRFTRFKAAVLKAGGMKPLSPKTFFINLKPAPLLVRRVGAGRWDLEHLHGPSIPEMLGSKTNSQSREVAERRAFEAFDTTFNDLLAEVLNGGR